MFGLGGLTCLGMLESVNCCRDEFENHCTMFGTEVFVIKEFGHTLLLKMDDRTRALYEAENDHFIGRIIELERLTSVMRLVQTLIVLLADTAVGRCSN